MASSVYIPIPVATVKEAAELPTRTYKLDLDKGRIVGMVEGKEAMRQATRKAILTPRFKCLCYNNQYGSEAKEAVIQKDASQEYIETVLPGFIKDALRPDTRILDVSNFKIRFEDDCAYISFDEDTIFGQVRIEEVI